MANNWTAYRSHPILADWTVTKMGPNSNITSAQTGPYTKGASTITTTTNSIASTSVITGLLYDATDLEITPPVDADGSTPDVEVAFTVDGTDYKNYMVIDGSADGNMFPGKKVTVGARAVRLGVSLRDLLVTSLKNGSVGNLPIKATGLKAKSSITVTVSSTAGWGQTGTPLVPMRIVLRGDVLAPDDIDQFTGVFQQNGRVMLSSEPTRPLNLNQALTNGSLSQSWSALPGGPKQTHVKINRRFTYASNQLAITSSNNFVFSQLQTVQGSQSNVVDAQHDLGDDFTQNNDVMIYSEFGIRLAAGVQGYTGFRIDGVIVPQDTPQGTPVSTGYNDWQYGSVQPLRSESNLYYSLPEARQFIDLMVHGNAAAPFFRAAGANIAAGDVTMVKGGVLIERQ